jgi:hypothetical protein
VVKKGKNLSIVNIFSLQKSDTLFISSLSDNTYKKITDKLNIKRVIINPIISLALKGNYKKLIFSELKSNSNNLGCYLFFELLNKDFLARDYEEIFSNLILCLEEFPLVKILGLIVSNKSQIQKTINYIELKRVCKSRDITLLLISTNLNNNLSIRVVINGLIKVSNKSFSIDNTPIERNTGEFETLKNEEIIKDFQKLFGHFKIDVNNSIYHTPVIASLKKLSDNQKFINRIYVDALLNLKGYPFLIKTFGIKNGSINNVALELTKFGNSIIDDYSNTYGLSSLLIFCDFLSPFYPIADFIKEGYKNGIEDVVVIGIEKFRNFNFFDEKIKIIYYGYENNYRAFSEKYKSKCIFCKHGDEPIVGNLFEDFEVQVKKYTSVQFWEFLNQNEKYFDASHWISPTTDYHYFFRPKSLDIFGANIYNITTRIYNIFKEKRQDENSIAKILCPDEPSSKLLAKSLALKWKLNLENDIILIPRKFIKSFAGNEISSSLRNYLQNKDLKIHPKQNVVILDQAAHNFKTLTALERISKYFQGYTIGSFVFIDRTKDEIFARYENIAPPYYFSLYRWPIQPLEQNHCPCEK